MNKVLFVNEKSYRNYSSARAEQFGEPMLVGAENFSARIGEPPLSAGRTENL